MAEQSPGDADMDFVEHEKTYRLFLRLTKWVTAACLLILIFMAVTLL
jgi:Ni,Fe-hydrogenase I cytochrome b subunit